MARGHKCGASILLASVLFAPVILGGCSAHASYRTYDAGYGDYHVWDAGENGYYTRWEVETHRDHRDFRRRKADEQKEYWSWRHNQH
jgi:hypothetical protein